MSAERPLNLCEPFIRRPVATTLLAIGMLLIGLVVLFGSLTAFVLRKTDRLQSNVEAYHSNLAEQASDALGNVPVIQSFTRIEAEVPWIAYSPGEIVSAPAPIGLFGAPPAITSGRLGFARFTSAGGDQAGWTCLPSMIRVPNHCLPGMPTATR